MKDLDQKKQGQQASMRRDIVCKSLENTLVNIDIMESRIFAVLQQQRRDIRQIIASL